MITQKGIRPPEKVSAAAQVEKIEAVGAKYKGQRVSQMVASAQAELLEAIAQLVGLADENGVIK